MDHPMTRPAILPLLALLVLLAAISLTWGGMHALLESKDLLYRRAEGARGAGRDRQRPVPPDPDGPDGAGGRRAAGAVADRRRPAGGRRPDEADDGLAVPRSVRGAEGMEGPGRGGRVPGDRRPGSRGLARR